MVKSQPEHHGNLRENTAPVEAHPAEAAAGARGGHPHGGAPLRHGADVVPLEEQGGQEGELYQVVYGMQTVRGKALRLTDQPVLRAVPDVVGAVVPDGPEKPGVGAGQVVDPAEPEQCLTAEHRRTSQWTFSNPQNSGKNIT